MPCPRMQKDLSVLFSGRRKYIYITVSTLLSSLKGVVCDVRRHRKRHIFHDPLTCMDLGNPNPILYLFFKTILFFSFYKKVTEMDLSNKKLL